eukprot:TRINITY_DN26884_c0_g1_i1.p1 TRINITY_DN26884_c0_g1~~TRINITY_DN26884_c0_g1_i1.p1  ORF type:complete len:1376 (-),score=103.66 TRINITY_DN26884_c0_g1_i1:40-4167(-)
MWPTGRYCSIPKRWAAKPVSVCWTVGLLVSAATLELATAQYVLPNEVTFEFVGKGDCTTTTRMPVRGKTRRDLTHGQCRALCDSDNCWGYTYAPCAQICGLHGEPTNLMTMPDPEQWGTMNGGGLISLTTEQCGSSCFVRKKPCDGGTLTSAGAYMDYQPLAFGTSRDLPCPYPHRSSVRIFCSQEGITVTSGRCLRPCNSGFVVDKNFRVQYPPTLDSLYGVGRCPTGTLGNMTVLCSDGVATWVIGQCGTNCPSGSLKSGTAAVHYGQMKHEERRIHACPYGWTGTVVLECINALVDAVSGRCQRHCDAGRVNTTTSGPGGPADGLGWASHPQLAHLDGVDAPCNSTDMMLTGSLVVFCKDGNVSAEYSQGYCQKHCTNGTFPHGIANLTRAVKHGVIEHHSNVSLECNPGFRGIFNLTCDNGQVIHTAGYCYMNCIPGSITSNTVNLPHPYMTHGEPMTLVCPTANHNGTIDVVCEDGAVVPKSGFCGENCPPGFVYSNGARTTHTELVHGEVKNFSCPYPWGDQLEMRCYDGSTRFSGRCGRQCLGGTVTLNGAVVFFRPLEHGEAANFSCGTQFPGSLSFTGHVTISCWDYRTSVIGACYPDCTAGRIRNNGARIIAPFIAAQKSLDLNCEPRAAFGVVEVTCAEGFLEVTKGSCGQPCAPGPFTSRLTRHTPIEVEEVGHATGIWKDCPQALSGQVYLECFDGILRVGEGECGERCPSTSLDVYGATFVSPFMDHDSTFEQPCLPPYRGVVLLNCTQGKLKTDSRCARGCFAGDKLLPGGATVPYPDLVSGRTHSPPCPGPDPRDATDMGFVGQVVLECVDGEMEIQSGACYAHCKAGRFTGPTGYRVNHIPIYHNDTSWASCPSGFAGDILLQCWGGQIRIAQGQCSRDCVSGSQFVRNGVVMKYQAMQHGEISRDWRCPNAFIGMVRVRCDDSVVSIYSGECLKHCSSGTIEGALYRSLMHDSLVSLVCPEVGEIKVRCWDGSISVLAGACLYGCDKGEVPDMYNVSIQHPRMSHDSRLNGTCSQTGIGQVELHCYNRVVTPKQGQRCQRHCPSQMVQSRDGTGVVVPYIEHLQSTSVACSGGLPGILSVRCNDYKTFVYDGVCGDMNCRPGTVTSNGAVLSHPIINDRRKAGPGQCGSGYIGRAVFICKNGSAEVDDVTIILQPRIPGLDNLSQIGPEYDYIEDDRFKLCGCCLPPPPQPDVAPVEGSDKSMILYWAIAVGGAGLLLAGVSGLWIMYMKSILSPKVSRVSPAPEKVAEGVPTTDLALEDNPKYALDDGADDFGPYDAQYNSQALTLRDAPLPAGNELALQNHQQEYFPDAQDTGQALREYLEEPGPPQPPPYQTTRSRPLPKNLRQHADGSNWQHW